MKKAHEQDQDENDPAVIDRPQKIRKIIFMEPSVAPKEKPPVKEKEKESDSALETWLVKKKRKHPECNECQRPVFTFASNHKCTDPVLFEELRIYVDECPESITFSPERNVLLADSHPDIFPLRLDGVEQEDFVACRKCIEIFRRHEIAVTVTLSFLLD